ncbi:hypothetical protein ScPMuIL_017672 [Solemya velum]
MEAPTGDAVSAAMPTFTSIGSSLYRARQEMYPSPPTTRQNIELKEQWTQTLNNQRFLLADDGEGDQSIIIFATDLMLQRLTTATTLYMDDGQHGQSQEGNLFSAVESRQDRGDRDDNSCGMENVSTLQEASVVISDNYTVEDIGSCDYERLSSQVSVDAFPASPCTGPTELFQPTRENCKAEVEENEKPIRLPPELELGCYDILVLYAEKDEQAADKFCEQLNQIQLDHVHGNNSFVRAILYMDTKITSIAGIPSQCLETGMNCCTLIFLFVTSNFVKDKWILLLKEAAFMERLRDDATKWTVIPVWIEEKGKINNCPIILRALKGLNHFDISNFSKKNPSEERKICTYKQSLCAEICELCAYKKKICRLVEPRLVERLGKERKNRKKIEKCQRRKFGSNSEEDIGNCDVSETTEFCEDGEKSKSGLYASPPSIQEEGGDVRDVDDGPMSVESHGKLKTGPASERSGWSAFTLPICCFLSGAVSATSMICMLWICIREVPFGSYTKAQFLSVCPHMFGLIFSSILLLLLYVKKPNLLTLKNVFILTAGLIVFVIPLKYLEMNKAEEIVFKSVVEVGIVMLFKHFSIDDSGST